MNKKSIVLTSVSLGIIAFALGALGYQYFKTLYPTACTADAKVCPDGSSVVRSAPKCEFAACPDNGSIVYKNEEYGFTLTLPASWQGYSITKRSWQGSEVSTGKQKYAGITLIIKNPQTTDQQAWQDIPIMVFSPDVWKLVAEEKVAVSAAPIPPQKIGESSKYVFATPPRWYGFTDAKGSEEAVEIVKTFKIK
jgi:hypothetical protein